MFPNESTKKSALIDFYFWPTPNGWKISIALEEMGLAYNVIPVHIGRGEQFTKEFERISPSHRMPVIVDQDPTGGGEPFALAESGAILMYLAEKTGQFLPKDSVGRYQAIQWLLWQATQLGPVMGQHGHFALYAKEKIPYAIARFRRDVLRLFKELNQRLEGRDHICDDYSIVDMACWPWVLTYKSQNIDLGDYPHIRRWYDALKTRPGLRRGYDLFKEVRSRRGNEAPDEEARVHLFGETRENSD